MTTPPPVRVMIIDDEPLARERLRTLLADELGVNVVAECGDGPAATSAIVALRPAPQWPRYFDRPRNFAMSKSTKSAW